MTESGPSALTTREKILIEGDGDWVRLQQIHEHVASEDPSASLAEVQRNTLKLVRAMAEEDLIALGEPLTMVLGSGTGTSR